MYVVRLRKACPEGKAKVLPALAPQGKARYERGTSLPLDMNGMRLAKYIAQTGYCARRKAEELILSGAVEVNGATVHSVTTFVDPETVSVRIFDKPIVRPASSLYFALHKPSGYLSTTTGDRRKKVPDLLPAEIIGDRRLFLVGRLDKETEGLILLTDDGQFAQELMHPSYDKEKEYEILVRGHMTPEALKHLGEGVDIVVEGEPYHTRPALVSHVRYEDKSTRLHLTIGEGKKRQIRLMCAALGHPVRYLRRVRIGSLTLGDLPLGGYRPLTEEEIQSLRAPR